MNGQGDAAYPSNIIRKAFGLILLLTPEFIPEIEPANRSRSAVGTVHFSPGDQCHKLRLLLKLTAMVYAQTVEYSFYKNRWRLVVNVYFTKKNPGKYLPGSLFAIAVVYFTSSKGTSVTSSAPAAFPSCCWPLPPGCPALACAPASAPCPDL